MQNRADTATHARRFVKLEAPMFPPRRRSSVPLATAPLALMLLTIALTGVGSTSCAAILNRDPALRWWAFKTYGADRICPEILKASLPLRLTDTSPTVGRYFPSSCHAQVNDDAHTVSVFIEGGGYAYLPATKRMGFTLNVAVEYGFDFNLNDDGAWVWGRYTRTLAGPDFRIIQVENKVADLAAVFSPVGSIANVFGAQLVNQFIARGFTVVETDNNKEFALGILPLGQHPVRPYDIDDDDEFYTFSNEIADVYNGQIDFVGPIEVTDDDQVIDVKGVLSGASGIDLILVAKSTGDAWRTVYQNGGPITLPPGPMVGSAIVNPGPFTRRFKPKPGLYYVVIDNSMFVGQMNPQGGIPNPVIDPSVRLTYVAQITEE